MGKKSGPKAPKSPDPTQTAAAQQKYDVNTAITNANLNRINQYGPQGSLTYSIDGYNEDGTPKYSQHETYSPEQQALYDQQMKIANSLSGLAGDTVGRARDTMSKEFNYNNMTPLQTNVQGGPIQNSVGGWDIQRDLDFSGAPKLPGVDDFSADAQRTQDAMYKQATSRLDPQWETQQRQLATQLAGKGITENSEAYRRAMDQAQRQKTDAYNQATWSSIGAGSQEQSRLFGLGLAARQQDVGERTAQGSFHNAAQAQGYGQNLSSAEFANEAQQQGWDQAFANAGLNNAGRQQQISEANYLRDLPLRDIQALMQTSGGAQGQDFQDVAGVGVSPIDYTGMVNQNYQNQMARYNAKQQARSQGLGSLFGLGGSVLGGMASAGTLFSDARLKERLRRIGTTAKGIPTYTFNYLGDRVKQIGVIAQDVLKVIPDAVTRHPNGFLMVDYGKVW